MKFFNYDRGSNLGTGSPLDAFEKEQDQLGFEVLNVVSPDQWTKLEEIFSTLERKPGLTSIKLQGVLPGVLADAMHEGFVKLNPLGTDAEWTLTPKGIDQLAKLRNKQG